MQEDIADIEAFMKQAGIRAVAEAVRAHSAELAVYQNIQQPAQIYPGQLPSDWWDDHRVVNVAPVGCANEPGWGLPWYRRRGTRVAAVTVAALGVLSVVIWAVVWIVTSMVTGAIAVVSTNYGVIESVAILVGLVLLCSMLGGRRGSGNFSGTFTGRMD